MKKIFLLLVVLGIVFSQSDNSQAQTELSMKRTACLVLSRYHSNTQMSVIEGLISSLEPEKQQKFINKMYALAIEHCMPVITMDQAQQFFVQNSDFQPQEMFYIFDAFDYENVVTDIDTLTKSQEALIKFIKNFDEEMAVRRQEKQAEKQESGQDSFQMNFFGFSFHEIPAFAKMTYVIIFVTIVGSAIFYMLSKLDNSKKSKSLNKRRKSPKKQ